MRFYDNATIDGDIISVKVNKKVVLSNQLLSDKPLTTHVKVTLETPMIEVEMQAENEGNIPPNTAMLEVSSPSVYHRLFMSSTKEKSAKVRFVYDKTAAKNTTAIGMGLTFLQPGIATSVIVN